MSFESDSAPASERRAVEQEAASYFDLAEQALAPRTPGLLLTCGVSGSGKTTLARQAAEVLDGVMVRSDAVRKHLAGIALDHSRHGIRHRYLYTRPDRAHLYGAAATRARGDRQRPLGHSGCRVRKTERTRCCCAAGTRTTRALRNPLLPGATAELKRRLDQRASEGRDISDATVEVLEQQLTHFEPPCPRRSAVLLDRQGRSRELAGLAAHAPLTPGYVRRLSRNGNYSSASIANITRI